MPVLVFTQSELFYGRKLMRKNASGRVVPALACLFIGMSCAATALAMDTDKPFRIGAVLSKTGAYSQYGDFTEQGLRVGIKEVNDRGGILGRKIELFIRDDASNPGRSLLAAKELLTGQKVDFLYP